MSPDMTDVKSDTKPAPHKYQPVRHDAHKAEAPRAEAPRAEAPRVEPPRLDAPKLDSLSPETPKAEPAKPRRLKRVLIRFLLLFIVPLAAILAGAYIYLTGGRYAGTDDAYTKADMVQISADISARVTKIEVKDNQPVKAGQVLFRLDDETFRIALEKAEAKLAHTRNDLPRCRRAITRRKPI
jgi:membrane fusion protein (multidrug efflux system)